MCRFNVLARIAKANVHLCRGCRGTGVCPPCYNDLTEQSNLREQHMAMHQINPQGTKLAALDPIWDRVRTEAEDIVRREPELASFIYSTVLHHERLEDSVVHRIAERLDHSALSGDLIRQAFDEALRDDPDLGNAFRADMVAVHRPLALFQGLPCPADASPRALALSKGPQGFRLLSAEPFLGGIPDRHQSRSQNRPRYLPRSRPVSYTHLRAH